MSDKASVQQRFFEIALILVCLGLCALLYRIGGYRMVVLNLFYLPVVLAAFFLGRYRAGILAVLCVVCAVFVTALDLSNFAAYTSPVMIGLAFHAITPFIGLTFALKGLVVMLLGGLGNVAGAMIGGLILGLAEVLAIVIFPTEINVQDIFSFGIMIIILIFRPAGLFGTRVTQG